MLRISLLITLCLISFCCYPFSRVDSTKTEEKFKCPAPYKCIEIKMVQGLLLESIPLDQPIIIYTKNTEGIKSGTYSVYEVKNEKKRKPIDSGPLRIDLQRNEISAVINELMKANKTYKFEFHTPIPLSKKKEVNKIIIDALLKVKRTAVSNKGISNNEIKLIQTEFSQNIPNDLNSLIKANSFLDRASSPYVFSPDDINFMDDLEQGKATIDQIVVLVESMSMNLDSFLTSANIDAVKAKNGDQMGMNLQSLASNGKKREIVLSGRANLENLAATQPALDLATIDVFSYDAFLKNIQTNINFLESWDRDGSIPDRSKLLSIIGDSKSIRRKLRSQFSDPSLFINGGTKAFKSALVDSIMTSIEGTSSGDFQQSSRWYVGADVGAIATNINGEPDGWHVLPYVGLNLSFVPVNKETSIKNLFEAYGPWAILKLASVNAGITITKINTEKYSGIYDFENQRGFIFGVGLRPWRGIKLGYGYLMINKKTGNSLNSSSKAISGKPYFSLSLDWDLRNILPNIKNIFTN
jgi:hypothetical protein